MKLNVFLKSNQHFFNDLNELVQKYPTKYQLKLDAKGRKREPNKQPKYKYLKDWIDFEISKYTNANNMHTTTKVYWILNGLTDFPKCKYCNSNEYYKNFKVSLNIGYPKYCSKKCIHNSKEIKNKIKKTCSQHYGVENPAQSEEIKEKIENTKLKKYGKKYFLNPTKARETKILKKQFDSTYIEKINEKIINTTFKKYGVKNAMKNKKIAQKAHNSFKKTMIEKYGVNSPWKIKSVQEKCSKTNMLKYGVKRPCQNHDIRVKSQQKYFYDNIHFDSTPEIAYYIWLKENNMNFEYQPNINFEYEANGKKHFYMPDFKVNNEYVELKGNQFLKEDGSWQNPYDHNQDGIYEAKRQCLLKNNIKIMYSNEYQKYIDYVNDKYGKDFLIKFKKVNNIVYE